MLKFQLDFFKILRKHKMLKTTEMSKAYNKLLN